jgi:hypothetical protein
MPLHPLFSSLSTILPHPTRLSIGLDIPLGHCTMILLGQISFSQKDRYSPTTVASTRGVDYLDTCWLAVL